MGLFIFEKQLLQFAADFASNILRIFKSSQLNNHKSQISTLLGNINNDDHVLQENVVEQINLKQFINNVFILWSAGILLSLTSIIVEIRSYTGVYDA